MNGATQKGADIGRLCMALALNDGDDVAFEGALLVDIDGARESLSHAAVRTAADRLAFLATMRDDIEFLRAGAMNPADEAAATRLRRMADALIRQASTESGLSATMFGPTFRAAESIPARRTA
ncbi:MAG: hypothetical protein P1U65_07560 [Minwuia sp.]|nr:hypothetical protein [Minwuia sp.]